MSRGEVLLVTVLNSLEVGRLVSNVGPQYGSPRWVAYCCRQLAFVEFKCTRSALLGGWSVGVVLLEQRLEARVVAEGVPGWVETKIRNREGRRY